MRRPWTRTPEKSTPEMGMRGRAMAPSETGSASLALTRKVGSIRIHALDAGRVRLEGGAMFGVVPRVLWEKRIAPDARHRIPIALRCLLIEAPDALVLVDTGVGNKEDAKFRDVFGVENDGDPTRLEDAIRAAGFDPGDVDIVLLTHLHFDHVGGAAMKREDGSIVPAFPKARYVVQRGELEFSRGANERIRASYLQRSIEPITTAGLWDLLDGDTLVTPGVRAVVTPGHTPHHQCVLVESGGETACFLADLCPTAAHLPLPWIMAYDLEPLVTLETKRALWRCAIEEDWLLVFEHDPQTPWGRLDSDGKALRLGEAPRSDR
ncbi:MAG: MBL fold metallo-hydrolase [Gemmatimonadetes bacterium]|nr:MBL fold metallo-hydrolase [Gemmatimonadota bacterium]